MLKLRLPKLVALGTFALGLFSTAYAEIAPLRVGPVSQYGQLQAGTNNAGEGRIYGSCEHFRSSGNEVQVKGMSLFWSCAANQQRYWKKDIITGLVERQNIQLIRAAMAVDDMGEWADGHYFTKPDFYQAMLDEAVEAAIENDIYVIIDFHSHVAADSVENAKDFFRIQAEKWGKYDNVIFEVFNEPICASGSVGDNSDCSNYGGFIGMDDIKTYADQVISVIREYSDNLIIVGTPMWDQSPNHAIYYPVEDPLERDNIAYAFHYYAGRADGENAHDFSLSSNADKAMQKGLSVFVSEWGTVGYDGGGAPSATLNPQWQTWMDSRKISSANWNVGKSGDPSSESGSEYFGFNFDPDNAPDNWTYSLSGQWVNANVFNNLPATYTACDDYVPASSSSFGSSSSGNALAYDVSPIYEYVYAGDGWTIANEEGEYGLVAEVIDEETGKPVIGLKGVVAEIEYGWAGIGMNVSDLDGCQLLQYDYKGLSHNLALANTPDGADVIVKYDISATDTWETFTLDMSALSGINLKSGLDIKWQLAAMGNGNLYVKEIQCVLDGGSSSSSGDEPASSSSGVELPVVAAPTTNTELFDDFEDGDYMPLWEGIGNFWAETDVVAGGGSSNAELSFVKGSASAKALQMSYSLDVGDYPNGPPYATISTNDFNEMNLSQCSEVRYDYKGSAHKFRLKVSPTMNDLLDMGWGYPTFAVTSPSESWQTVTIPVASLRQEWTGSSDNRVDVETVLQYANGFDWRVDGEDTDDKSSGTLAIDNIRCVGLAKTQYYRITFMNGTEPYEAKDWAAGSNVPDPEGTPAKAPDAQFTCTFSNWTYGNDGYGNPTRYVTGTATYEAVYDSVLRAYTVTFLMDDDATPVENGVVENVNYGTPVADIVPAAPTKDADAQFTYTFGGWNPAFTDETIVTGDVSYKATFTTVTNKYSVAFVDDDETSLKTAVEYDYGTPVDQIDVPVVGDKGSLKFAGWEPGLATVTKDVTYKAVYTNKIVITWKDDDGSTLRQDFLDNGEMPEYDPAPGKDPTAEFTYTFDRWTPTVVVATENASYTASYTSVKNKYDVTFVAEHNPDANITVSKEYGEAVASFAPQVDGAVTAEYTYVFDGWMPVITDQTVVTGGVTYTAKYKQVKNKYEVSFVGDDGVKGLPAARLVDYGTEIATLIPSTDPYKDQTVAKTYEFDRWVVKVSDTEDMELAEGAVLVAGMTLKAVFKEFDRRYVITFVDYDDTPRWGGGTLYTYGTAAADIVKPDDPSRDPDDEFSYTFAGWTPTVTAVTGEQIYKAAYTQTALVGTTYTVAFTGDADVTGIPSSMTVEEGTLVSTLLPSTNPGKPQTDEFTYTFNKWVVVNGTSETDLVAGAAVTGDLTLKAVFTSVTRTYSVTFASEVGVTGLPAAATVEYGVAVSTLLPSTNPGKTQTDEFTYTFNKWVVVNGTSETDLSAGATVTGDLTLKAVFTATVRRYEVVFLDYDNRPLTDQTSYAYGTPATDITPEAPTRDPDDEFSYAFAGWSPAVTMVTGEATYTATYTSTALPASSSSEEPESSSSVKPVESSSSDTPVVSSSSEKPVASSSSETPVVSSSSKKEKLSSSSADKPKSSSSKDDKSSSSGKADGFYPTVVGVNMFFAHNELTVTVPQASEVKVLVFDMQGLLQEHYVGYSAGDHVVSLGHLNRGVYIVRVAGGNVVKTQRIMIK